MSSDDEAKAGAPHEEMHLDASNALLLPNYTIAEPTQKSTLRAGRWFPEEERYAARLITEFRAGTLPLSEKITLREFLSLIFHCPPMRITKKFEGNNMIGKINYKRRGNLDTMGWWELKELERRFWDRMVKSRSPTALEAHAKMVEYSSRVFRDAPDLSALNVAMEDQQVLGATLDMGPIQSMLDQLGDMLRPIVEDDETANHVHTIETMLEHSHTKQMDLVAMSDAPDLTVDRKQLIDSARFRLQLDIEELETLRAEAREATMSKIYRIAMSNMLILLDMVHKSTYKLFRMEYKCSLLTEQATSDQETVKTLSHLVKDARENTQVLEHQLQKMKVEMNQKYHPV